VIENAAGRLAAARALSVPQLSIKDRQSAINNESPIKDHQIFN
jgi:hypothetical protein